MDCTLSFSLLYFGVVLFHYVLGQIYLILVLNIAINLIASFIHYRDWGVHERSRASYSARGDDTSRSMRWTPTRFANVPAVTPAPGIIQRQEFSLASHTHQKISAHTTGTACPNLHQTPTDSSETKIEWPQLIPTTLNAVWYQTQNVHSMEWTHNDVGFAHYLFSTKSVKHVRFSND